ncbi:aspartic proteinase CDR1-like [Nicotiana tomentosiformis]|uniref:aspartic proteinase CDR1-like n=1 Tax=Nicotiana tomentosiformis TaxID=4098 RepID=UPI00388C512C
MINALQRSINRANLFTSNSQLSTSIIPDIKGLYLTKISIGTKPSVKLAVVDTGSDIIWIQCQPCIHCFQQKTPIFNPKSSSTYKSISCNSTRCKNLPGSSCDLAKNTCLYSARYNDQSFSFGDLATETFTFDDSTNITRKRRLSLSNITFGCGRRNNLTIGDVELSGIIGLGASPFSLVSQIKSTFGRRFSYCLVPFYQLNVSSRLNFGEKALLSGVKLNAINSFVNIGDGIVCLAFAPTEFLPIFGNVAQTNFLVGYDLDKMIVSFEPTNCA